MSGNTSKGGLPPLVLATALLIAWPSLANSIKVATFNIHHGVGLDGQLDLSRTAAAILAVGADVIVLQESDVYFSPRSDCKDQIYEIGQYILHAYFYRYFSPSIDWPGDLFQCGWGHRRKYGNVIISRYPLKLAKKTSLPSHGGESRVLLSAIVQTPWGDIALHGTHLGIYSDAERHSQASMISGVIGSYFSGKSILLGDMNALPSHWTLDPIRNIMREASLANGTPWGGVDHIYSNIPDSFVVGVGEFVSNASDHNVRWAEFWIQ